MSRGGEGREPEVEKVHVEGAVVEERVVVVVEVVVPEDGSVGRVNEDEQDAEDLATVVPERKGVRRRLGSKEAPERGGLEGDDQAEAGGRDPAGHQR